MAENQGGAPDLSNITGKLDAMVKGMQILAEGLTKMETRLGTLEGGGGGPTGKDKQEHKDVSADLDLDTLSNKELADVMMARMLAAIEDGPMAKMMEQMKQVAERVGSLDGRVTYGDLKGKHGDLDNWITEVQDELKRNPALTAEDALVLARTRNPEKLAKLEAERSKLEEAKKGEGKLVFSGLSPRMPTGTSDDKKLDTKAAAEAAWASVMSDIENLPFGDDSSGET